MLNESLVTTILKEDQGVPPWLDKLDDRINFAARGSLRDPFGKENPFDRLSATPVAGEVL